MQPSSSSICTVGGLSTCGSTTVGTRLRRRRPRVGKRSRYRRTECEVSTYLTFFSFPHRFCLSQNRVLRRNSSYCAVVSVSLNLGKSILHTHTCYKVRIYRNVEVSSGSAVCIPGCRIVFRASLNSFGHFIDI